MARKTTAEAMARAWDYLVAHACDAEPTRGAAAQVGIGCQPFIRAFRKRYGLTPHRFVCHCRVRRAGRLLAESERPVTDIAVTSGYCDGSHLVRAFRAAFGMTPTQFRRACRTRRNGVRRDGRRG